LYVDGAIGAKMMDDQFLMHIVNVLPMGYSVLVTLLGRRIGHKMNPLTIEELRSELMKHMTESRTVRTPVKL
jgi:hypothetical protein